MIYFNINKDIILYDNDIEQSKQLYLKNIHNTPFQKVFQKDDGNKNVSIVKTKDIDISKDEKLYIIQNNNIISFGVKLYIPNNQRLQYENKLDLDYYRPINKNFLFGFQSSLEEIKKVFNIFNQYIDEVDNITKKNIEIEEIKNKSRWFCFEEKNRSFYTRQVIKRKATK